MGRVELDLARGQLLHDDIDLCTLDGLIVKKISASYSPATLDRLEMLRVAEARGVRVFSPATNMLRLVDRLSCTVTLRNAGIPMPATRITEDIDLAVQAVADFGSAVFKPLYSTKARGMCVIDHSVEGQGNNGQDIRARVSAFQADNPVMYIQQRIDLPGRDLGMLFLDGDYLGCYARVSRGDAWNTTIDSGGRYAAHQATTAEIELAHRAQALFGMDFTTVDVAQTADGPIVFEVSAFGGFRGASEGIGIDVAELYVDHAIRNLEKRS
jgi:ribosomal protein S6--L-glutamate ligase